MTTQTEHDCTRSHPHEEMSKECELRTEIARLRNKLAQRTWVGMTDEEILSWWSMDNGLEDLDMCNIIHFRKVVEEVEARLKRKNT